MAVNPRITFIILNGVNIQRVDQLATYADVKKLKHGVVIQRETMLQTVTLNLLSFYSLWNENNMRGILILRI